MPTHASQPAAVARSRAGGSPGRYLRVLLAFCASPGPGCTDPAGHGADPVADLGPSDSAAAAGDAAEDGAGAPAPDAGALDAGDVHAPPPDGAGGGPVVDVKADIPWAEDVPPGGPDGSGARVDAGDPAADGGTFADGDALEDGGLPVEDGSEAADAGAGGDDAGSEDAGDGPDAVGGPKDPVAVFGSRYWDVYRPALLARFFEDGRVTDRIVAGTKMFGDNTVFMGYALSTFVYEHMAAGLPESLGYIHRILDAYAELDALPANPALGYLVADPLDGYVYRSDRGPDYETNFCQIVAGFCWPDLGSRSNEPSGDQCLGTLRALKDVVDYPGPLVHDGTDLKGLARAHAERIGHYLKEDAFMMKNVFGDEVKRGPDQRWVSWSFQQGAAQISGKPKSDFEATWHVLGIAVPPSQHWPFARLFMSGAVKFTAACVSGASIDLSALLGIPYSVDLACNEFNIGLGGDAAVISLSTDPASDHWFSAVIDRADLVAEGNALYAMYARYRFGDTDPALLETAALFLTAPATPPRGDNADPFGWCRSWRWAHDFDTPGICISDPHLFEEYSGLDYMLPRAMASAFGELPE